MRRILSLGSAAAVALSACVSMSDHEAVLADLSKTQLALQGSEERVRSLEEALDEERKRAEELSRKIAGLEGELVDAKADLEAKTTEAAALETQNAELEARLAEVLRSIPDRSFQVEGHTDNVPIRTKQYPSNWELAAARALTVVKTMVESGMPPERVSAASYGEHRPAAPNDTEEGRAQNRRIEIVVVPDLSSLPGSEELKTAAEG